MRSTIIERLQAITAPPLVQLTLLPSHQLMTLKTYHGTGHDGHVVTIYEDPSRYQPVLRLHAHKIGLYQRSQQRPFMTPPMLHFAENHCRTCPHNFPVETGSTPCMMRTGFWREAFRAQEVNVPQPVSYDVDLLSEPIAPIPIPRETAMACLAGAQDPSNWDYYAEAERRPPLVFVPTQPVSVSVNLQLTDINRWKVNHMAVQHLIEHQGAYYTSNRIGHLNTFDNGQRICWGSGNRAPALVSILDTFHGAIFNLDLTNDFNDWLNRVDAASKDAKTIRDKPEELRLRYLKDNHYTTIDPDSIVSVNNEINGFINIPPGADDSGYASGYTSLAASGCPVSDDKGMLLPIKRHGIRAGDRLINGFITPIIPAIGRCWFIQQGGDTTYGQLLGQIDPPEIN